MQGCTLDRWDTMQRSGFLSSVASTRWSVGFVGRARQLRADHLVASELPAFALARSGSNALGLSRASGDGPVRRSPGIYFLADTGGGGGTAHSQCVVSAPSFVPRTLPVSVGSYLPGTGGTWRGWWMGHGGKDLTKCNWTAHTRVVGRAPDSPQ